MNVHKLFEEANEEAISLVKLVIKVGAIPRWFV
jgi:hypothetical protein